MDIASFVGRSLEQNPWKFLMECYGYGKLWSNTWTDIVHWFLVKRKWNLHFFKCGNENNKIYIALNELFNSKKS